MSVSIENSDFFFKCFKKSTSFNKNECRNPILFILNGYEFKFMFHT